MSKVENKNPGFGIDIGKNANLIMGQSDFKIKCMQREFTTSWIVARRIDCFNSL